jgi:hypothetical protein
VAVKVQVNNPIRVFALFCVAATSGFFGYLAVHLIGILQSPDWCGRAIQADRITPGSTFVGLTGCMDLLKMQVGALAKALLIVIGTFALCLGVLMVIVVAGARLAGKLFGNEVDVSRDDGSGPLPVTVTNTPSAPVPTSPVPPVPTGPAMPPPPEQAP